MKKLILGSAIVAVLGVASNAMAAPNSGTVNFTGSVTTATCDFSLKDSTNGDIANVDLGLLSTTSAGNGTPVVFKLVPSDNACVSKTAANVSWTSPTLAPTGITNDIKTGGTNAYLKVAATNATQKGNAAFIQQGQTVFDYTATAGKIPSFDYSAVLTKPATGLTAGAFNASASYVVAYK
ncbi:fimbrial protein [Citrobacter sp. Cb041]|uniref:fimbrial protein n=1 Tax=Enterobacteriaceae TaxID=543 RepID=UPI001299CC0D|nr:MULTISPECIES: fimbrial protein [Enterobacteriaceae]MBJ9571666.1 fimbrial protein [Citrobacter braakii]MCF2001680.1 fimbrial protein [Escherichia coli]MCF2474211.1 fimbrial protein [Citrobacter braakii]MDM3467860.1 fimbrial protein [Citrobacter sp. Cb041]MDU2944364.1 fimbrial protein [Citrobacter sp.]